MVPQPTVRAYSASSKLLDEAAAVAAEKPRLPEDEVANCFGYFESLVYHWQTDKEMNWDRIDALPRPENLV